MYVHIILVCYTLHAAMYVVTLCAHSKYTVSIKALMLCRIQQD